MKNSFQLNVLGLALGLGCLLQAVPVGAQSPYVPVWVDKTAVLSDADTDKALDAIAAQQSNPAHIVVLVHGFDTPRDASTQEYNELAPRISQAFQAKGQPSVVVVGFQWDSSVDVGLLKMEGAYLDTVPVARSVGRSGLRHFMVAARKRFPQARYDLLSHSMGCELSVAGLMPDMYLDPEGNPTAPLGAEVYQPQQEISLNFAGLCGSDLDYDAFYKGNVNFRSDNRRCQLAWLTMSPIMGADNRDSVLDMRNNVRGRAAGATFPRMTEQQYDTIFKARGVVFDSTDIPTDHAMTKYYDDERVGRMVEAILYVANPSQAPEPVEFKELDQVLAAPNTLPALQPWLDNPHVGTAICALWRVENLDCGSSKHLSDQTLPDISRLLRKKAQEIWGQRKDSPCLTIRKGYWPTDKQMTRAGAPPWANQ